MSEFEDHLWREVVRVHGDALTRMPRPTRTRTRQARPRLVVGGGLGLAGVGGVVALLLGVTTASPAFAVTPNHDGTVTVSIKQWSGIAGANAKLHQLGVRATVASQPPSGCQPTLARPVGGQGAPAPSHAMREIANTHWTIDPRQIPPHSTLALTPPPTPPGQDTGNSGNSDSGGSGGSGGQVWSCGTEGPGNGGPPPSPPSSNSGNSGASGNS